MKANWMALALVAAIAGTASAADEAKKTDAERLAESLKLWEKAKKESNGNYSYTVRWSSAFGFGHVTTVKVEGNKVTERTFAPIEWPMPGEKPEEPKAKWTETGKDIGSHKDEGVPAKTVDDLYIEAKKILEEKLPENERLVLGFDKAGLLSYCFTIDTRIADDAPAKGVKAFVLKLEAKK